ncbi:Nuclear pore [Pyrenophora seminiperda CCB06]|uniref:Nuclear pore n=1 Tax=Pyrenophora seminiperda CCB06 TaxID=1302712 RepID=A0A3M7LZL8_9PLEO|nr:Nuclear pore [Pyrenophora seminiperda CCB06]
MWTRLLASPWFRRTLTRKEFAESLRDPSDGRYHIQANDWDEEALLILLNIFHVRTRRVPATVSLEMLAKIAVLVDYYELENAEVMERDTKDWIANVRRSVAIPSSYCRDLMLWICISRVFCMREEFEKTTAVAIKETSIERSRCNALEHIISELHRLLGAYRDISYSCPNNSSYSFQCGAFLFGALMKYMERWGYLSPRPESPFMGISLNAICNRSGMAENTRWWHKSGRHGYYGGYDHDRAEVHSCSLNSRIEGVVQDAMANVKGLKFQDLPENSQASFAN